MNRIAALTTIYLAVCPLYAQIPANAKAQNYETQLVVQCDAPGNVFTDLKNPSFTLSKDCPVPELRYEIRDWRGTSVAKGLWKETNSRLLTFNTLALGYYTLFIEADGFQFEGSKSFAIVSDPSKRQYTQESFFAVNCMPTWLTECVSNPRIPENIMTKLADLSWLAGVPTVREMVRWGDEVSAKNPYEYDWSRYLKSSQQHFKKGIQFCGYFEDAPLWAKQDTARRGAWRDYYKTTESEKLPSNLFALYEFTKVAASTFRGRTDAWEFWNEEDAPSYCTEPAWDFAAAQKVAYLGVKAGNPNAKVLNGSFSVYPFNRFHKELFENGIGSYFDIFNNHIYNSLSKYPAIMRDAQSLLKKYGLEGTPIWITESGSRYEGHGRKASYLRYRNGHRTLGDVEFAAEHDLDQELILAEFIPKSMTVLQSLGVAKGFIFSLHPVNEQGGRKAWGLLRWDYSAKPAYVALANLTRNLEGAKYLGRLNIAEGVCGFLYQMPDKSQTLVFWSESELDKVPELTSGSPEPEINIRNDFAKDISIELPASGVVSSLYEKDSFKMTDIMGGESYVRSEKGILKLKATRFPAYLSGLSGLAASEVTKPEPARKAIDPSADLSIVTRVFLSDDFTVIGSRDSAILKNKSGKLSIDIFNFSEEIKKGTIQSTGDGSLKGLPQELLLNPMSRVRLQLEYTPLLPKDNDLELRVGGSFNGKRISSLHIPIVLLNESKAKAFEFANAERWGSNSSGEMTVSVDNAEKALKFHADFSKTKSGDFWVYPEYALNPTSEKLAGAIVISFDIKATQKGVEKKYPHSNLMIVYNNGKEERLRYPPPSEDWQTRYIAIDAEKSTEIKLIRIGMGAKSEKLDFWLKGFKIYCSK